MRRTVLAGLTTLAMLGAGALVALPAQATISTLMVSNTDSDVGAGDCSGSGVTPYTTISDAVAHASAGDVIRVCAGTYNESVFTSIPLTILGNNDGNNGYGTRNAESIVNSPDPSAFYLTGTTTTVSGFTIEGTAKANAGVVAAADNSHVSYNIFADETTGVVTDHSGLVVSNNSFPAPSVAGGISVELEGVGPTNDATIESNHFVGGASNSSIDVTTEGPTTGLVISNNTADMTGGGTFATVLAADSPSITGNTITGDADSSDGIVFAGSVESPSVTGNTVTGLTAASAIHFDFPANAAVTQNIGGAVLSNNLIGNEIGLDVSDLADASTIEAHGNILADNSTAGVKATTTAANVDASDNYWGCNNGPGQTGCSSTLNSGSGAFSLKPWAVLNASVASTSIPQGTSTTFRADLTHNSDNELMPELVPDNALTAAFSFDKGTVNPLTAPIVSGVATTTAHGTTVGNGTVQAQITDDPVPSTVWDALVSASLQVIAAVPPPTLPALTIHDASIVEGNSGTHGLVFKITMNKASTKAVTLHFTTANGSAVAGSDFVAKSGTLTIAKGKKYAQVVVLIKGDKTKEANESFAVNIFNPTNARIADAVGTGVIRNDDH